MRLKRRAFEPQQVDLLGVSLIELISGDHLERERPDMLVRQLLDDEKMSNLHGCRRETDLVSVFDSFPSRGRFRPHY
jgi:hypothetical protein